MALPATIRVKLSSEDAGAITMSPVVVQEMRVCELVEVMLGVAGKDAARIREWLARGSLTSGATRFRWAGCEVDEAAVRELLALFPDPDPSRAFQPARCVRAVLHGGRHGIELPRETGARRRLFRRRSFWDVLLEAAGTTPTYTGYSYKEHADVYTCGLDAAAAGRLREAAGRLVYAALAARIRGLPLNCVELFVERG